MKKHDIRTHTNIDLVNRVGPNYDVTVYWTTSIDEATFASQSIPRLDYKADPQTLKRGVGKLLVEVHHESVQSAEEAMQLAEGVAAVQIVDYDGINVFGFTIETSVIRDNLNVITSNTISRNMLDIAHHQNEYTDEELSSLAKGLSLSAYLYGSHFDVDNDCEWVKPYLEGAKEPDMFNTCGHFPVEKRLRVDLAFGEISITPRTIQDYLYLPFMRYQREHKNFQDYRPYDAVKKVITNATTTLPDNHVHTQAAVRSLGPDAMVLLNESAFTTIRIKPYKGRHIAVGFRTMHSAKMKEKLASLGYLPTEN